MNIALIYAASPVLIALGAALWVSVGLSAIPSRRRASIAVGP